MMNFLDVSGARLCWKREGRHDAPAIVLLNSIGTDMELWDGVAPHLLEQFALVRIDTRGHGGSTAARGDYSMSLLASDVLAVADAAGLGSFALAGVSLGGMIGMEFALQNPERLERLALICTSATMDAASWDDRAAKVRREGMAGIADLAMSRFLSDAFAAANPALYDKLRRKLITMDPEGYAGCSIAIRDMDLGDRIAEILSPTLVVTGSNDISTPYEGHGEHLVARIPGAIHRSLDTAHLAPLEAPEALGALLVSFFEG